MVAKPPLKEGAINVSKSFYQAHSTPNYLYNDLRNFFYVYAHGYNNSKRIMESIKATKKFIKLLKPFEKIGLFLNG
jgi:hypothetical protein